MKAEQWNKFLEAARWAKQTAKSRRESPKSVLDVAPDGYNVPWSEVCARFPELTVGSVIDSREAFATAYKKVKAN